MDTYYKNLLLEILEQKKDLELMAETKNIDHTGMLSLIIVTLGETVLGTKERKEDAKIWAIKSVALMFIWLEKIDNGN